MVSHLKGLATGREKQIYTQIFAKVFWVLAYTALVYFSSCLHLTPSCSFHCHPTLYPYSLLYHCQLQATILNLVN